MSIREYAKSRGFEVVGKLTYKGKDEVGYKVYEDEAGNTFWQSSRSRVIVIADTDGGVW